MLALFFLVLFTQPIILVQTKFKVLLGERSDPLTLGVLQSSISRDIAICMSVCLVCQINCVVKLKSTKAEITSREAKHARMLKVCFILAVKRGDTRIYSFPIR